jgi:quercetin dioxygenase-like cupin family protein
MAIPHASPAEIIDIRALGSQLASAETTTLLKTYDLEVIRMVLPAAKEVPAHALPREVILQCLEGRVEVHTAGRHSTLEAGHLLFLAGHQAYALRATVNSSLLVTILLEHKAAVKAA